MWIRSRTVLQARMPGMRPPALNPRSPAKPAGPDHDDRPADSEETPAEATARAGGFHESSYELQHGLQVSESDWPDDVTVPGGLGER